MNVGIIFGLLDLQNVADFIKQVIRGICQEIEFFIVFTKVHHWSNVAIEFCKLVTKPSFSTLELKIREPGIEVWEWRLHYIRRDFLYSPTNAWGNR